MPQSQRTSRARPFVTYYYTGTPSPSSWSRIGRAVTRQGAICAATRRLVDGEAKTALVCDEGGYMLVRISKLARMIRIEEQR